jgi:hypothetical protein
MHDQVMAAFITEMLSLIDIYPVPITTGDRHWVDVNQAQYFSGDRHWVDVNQTQYFSGDRH